MPLKLWLPDYADAGMPSRSASSARTSVTYCKPSSSGIRCSRSWSVGSLIQPSMGMALSGITVSIGCLGSHWAGADLTWMENVAQGAVVKNHDGTRDSGMIRKAIGRIEGLVSRLAD